MLEIMRIALPEANWVFQNSRVHTRLRLAGCREVAYQESGDSAVDLARLASDGDGFLDGTKALRDEAKADLVCLVVESCEDRGFSGSPGPSASRPFSVIKREQLSWSFHFPLVLSFNFGCQLERGVAESPGAFEYSYGYSFVSADQVPRSTADGFTGIRVPWFSNPEILYNGVPTGVPAGQANAADNSRTINQTAPLVSAFRAPSPVTIPPRISLVQPAGNTTSPLQLTQGENLHLLAEASDVDGTVARVNFFIRDSWQVVSLLGSVTSPPYEIDWVSVFVGDYTFFAQAVDDLQACTMAEPLDVHVRGMPPANDNFIAATQLTGTDSSLAESARLSSLEPGEPAWGDGSVWYKWTAPANGQLRLSMPIWPYGTLFGITTGTNVSNLDVLADNNAASGWSTSI